MQAQLTSAAVKCNWEIRNWPSRMMPVGMGVLKVRPCGPKRISMRARIAIDRAMVSMITDSIGRPDRGWIRKIWISTPIKAAAPTMNRMASGNGSPNRETAVTAKYAPQTTNMPCAKLNTSVALKITAKPRATSP